MNTTTISRDTGTPFYSAWPIFNVYDGDDRVVYDQMMERFANESSTKSPGVMREYVQKLLPTHGVYWDKPLSGEGGYATLHYVSDKQGAVYMRFVSIPLPLYRYLQAVDTVSRISRIPFTDLHSSLRKLFVPGKQVNFVAPCPDGTGAPLHFPLVIPECVTHVAERMNYRHNMGAGEGDISQADTVTKSIAFRKAIQFLDTGLGGYVVEQSESGYSVDVFLSRLTPFLVK